MIAKKKLPLLAVLSLALTGCLIVMLPQCLEFIIAQVQIFLHRTLRKPEKWTAVLIYFSRAMIFFIMTVAFLNFTASGSKIITRAKTVFSVFFSCCKKKDALLTLFLLAAFFAFCFYRDFDSDYLYQDDVFRHVTGDRSWIGFSRYVSEFLSILLHTGIKISDIAPLAQLAAIFLMVLEVALLSCILDGKISLPTAFALSLIFVNPIFAQNISYRYDAPYMALSTVFPTVPFLFCSGGETDGTTDRGGAITGFSRRSRFSF